MKYLLFSLTLFLGILLSGCCDKTFCNQVQPGFENTFYFTFNTDPLNQGFSVQELDTIWLQKHTKGRLFDSPLEKLTVSTVVMIGEDDKPDFVNYDYVLTTPDTAFRFEITDLVVAGETFTNRCSSCYYNTKKECKINGMLTNRSGSNEYIVLSKP